MKTKILFLGIPCLFDCTNSNETDRLSTKPTEPLSIHVSVVTHVNYEWFKQERGFYRFDEAPHNATLYPVEITLRNNTDSALGFWEMTCSWQSNWITSDTSVWFYISNCDGNFPTIIHIEPGKEYSHKCFLWSSQPVDEIINHKMKLGFVIIGEKDYSNLNANFSERVSKEITSKNLVWSNLFQLQ